MLGRRGGGRHGSKSSGISGAAAAEEGTPLLSAAAKPRTVDADEGGGGDAEDLGSLAQLLKNNEKPLAYTLLTTLATAPTLLFSNLHMVAFLKVHGLSASQVVAAQAVYAVWNTLNDVVAGYSGDFYAARYGSRLGILCGAQIVWNLVTCLPFISFSAQFTHGLGGTLYYLACISLYDGCVSIVGVARVALVAEITKTEGECVHVKRLNCVFGNAEALVMLVGYALWNVDNLWPFRQYLGGVTVMAIGFGILGTWRLTSHIPPRVLARSESDLKLVPPLTFLRALPRDAWVFIGVTALHELQAAAQGSILLLAIESLLSDSTKSLRVSFVGILGAVSGVTTFLLTWVADSIGLYAVLRWTFLLKAAIGLFLLWALQAGATQGAVACAALLVNGVSVAILSGFHFVVMVSLVDQLAMQRRDSGERHPLAAYPQACGPAMLLGISAFFVKPFGSVGPVVSASLFAGGEDLDAKERAKVLFCIAALPLVVGSLQWLLWRQAFSLRGRPMPMAH